MFLVCLIGLDIGPDSDRVAGKGASKDGGILCSFEDGLILVQCIGLPKARSAADEPDQFLFRCSKHIPGKGGRP